MKCKLISCFQGKGIIKKTTQPVAFRIVRKRISAAHENDLVLKIVINQINIRAVIALLKVNYGGVSFRYIVEPNTATLLPDHTFLPGMDRQFSSNGELFSTTATSNGTDDYGLSYREVPAITAQRDLPTTSKPADRSL